MTPSLFNDLFDDWQHDARNAVEQALTSLLDARPANASRLDAAIRYSLLANGKRLRPLLCIAACEFTGGTREQALPAACAIEMIHTYSLIHDDLPAMDDDDLRRGRASCHKAFDDATAILAGDALQPLAFEQLASQGNYSDSQRLAMLTTLAKAAGGNGMVAGQMQDMQAEGKTVSLDTLETIHHLKTGRMIEASLLLGAQAADHTDCRIQETLQQIGQRIGLAFQVQDDILDVTSTAKQLGKHTGADKALQKSTFPALLGLEESKAYANRLCQEALDLLGDSSKAAPLRAITTFIVARQR